MFLPQNMGALKKKKKEEKTPPYIFSEIMFYFIHKVFIN